MTDERRTNEEAVLTLQEALDNAFDAGIEIITRDGGEAIEIAIEALKERKTGKWITERIGVRSYATKCSACGDILHRGHNFDNAQQYTEYVKGSGGYDKFCHECGAKMEVDE